MKVFFIMFNNVIYKITMIYADDETLISKVLRISKRACLSAEKSFSLTIVYKLVSDYRIGNFLFTKTRLLVTKMRGES